MRITELAITVTNSLISQREATSKTVVKDTRHRKAKRERAVTQAVRGAKSRDWKWAMLLAWREKAPIKRRHKRPFSEGYLPETCVMG